MICTSQHLDAITIKTRTAVDVYRHQISRKLLHLNVKKDKIQNEAATFTGPHAFAYKTRPQKLLISLYFS